MRRKPEPTADDIMNLWLVKYHGITVEELCKKEPVLITTSDWYKKYAVTQEQHDLWYDEAIELLSKYHRWSKKFTKRQFWMSYLNLAPSVIEIKEDEINKT
jgi:hypothetical protein